MNKYHLILSILGLFFTGTIWAQTAPSYEMKPYRDSTNKLYWNKNQEVFISLSTTRDGEREVLESEISKEYTEPFFFDTEGLNYMRSHWAVDKETKKSIVPQKELLWEIYADSRAPAVKPTFAPAPNAIIEGVKIYGKNAALSFSAKDEISGVQALNISVNNAQFANNMTDVAMDKEGEYSVKYFAVDNVGNSGKIAEIKFKVDITAPETSCTITGINLGKNNIIGQNTKIYLNAKDNMSGVAKTYWSIDEGPKNSYNGSNIPLATLNDGRHTLKFYTIDKVDNQESEQTFEFYLDKTAPITASDVLGDRFIVGEQIYFSGRTKLKLTAVDNKAGVKDVMYSINGDEFSKYNDPFYLPTKQGYHIVKYYALDSTENITTGDKTVNSKYLEFRQKVDKIYVDLTGPSLSHSIQGDKFTAGDTVYIGPDTKIKMWGSDAESGLQYISYSVDGEQKENRYEQTFSLGDKPSGLHKVEYFAYDNVNNRNIDEFYVFLDNDGPEINYLFSIVPSGTRNGLEIYPDYSSLFITVQDKLTGINEIFYTLNGGTQMTYKSFIEGFKKNKVNTVVITAYDKLNNKTIKEIKFYAKNK